MLLSAEGSVNRQTGVLTGYLVVFGREGLRQLKPAPRSPARTPNSDAPLVSGCSLRASRRLQFWLRDRPMSSYHEQSPSERGGE